MNDRVDLVTPIGRLVGGSLSKKYDKDHLGNLKKNPNFFFAVAFSKTDPAVIDMITKMYQVAATGYQSNPQVIQNMNASWQNSFGPGFAWKIEDGDNSKFKDRAGYPGHYVIGFSTTLDFYTVNQQNSHLDPETIKNGYFVDVAFNVQINGNTDHTAGVYVNPQCVRMQAYGEEIMTGPSPAQLMANANQDVALPPGASTTPLNTPNAGVPGGMPQQPAPAPAPVPALQQQPLNAPNAGMPQQPAPNAGMPQQPAPAPALQRPTAGNDVSGVVPTDQANYHAQTQAVGQTIASPGSQAPALQQQGVQPNHNFVNGPAGNMPPLPGQ